MKNRTYLEKSSYASYFFTNCFALRHYAILLLFAYDVHVLYYLLISFFLFICCIVFSPSFSSADHYFRLGTFSMTQLSSASIASLGLSLSWFAWTQMDSHLQTYAHLFLRHSDQCGWNSMPNSTDAIFSINSLAPSNFVILICLLNHCLATQRKKNAKSKWCFCFKWIESNLKSFHEVDIWCDVLSIIISISRSNCESVFVCSHYLKSPEGRKEVHSHLCSSAFLVAINASNDAILLWFLRFLPHKRPLITIYLSIIVWVWVKESQFNLTRIWSQFCD